MTAPTAAKQQEWFGMRMTGGYKAPILAEPAGGKIPQVKMPDGFQSEPLTGATIAALAFGHVASGLSELWNLTAAAPQQISGPSLQELDDAADAMATVVATQLGRVAGFAARNLGGVTIAASGGLWDFHLAGQHDQASHGRGGDYHATYGDVIDEASAGADSEYTVAYTQTSDMHIAFDDPEGTGNLADREVLAEISPDGARGLADELRWAADYDHSNDIPNDEGIVDSVGVAGAEHLQVWVHQTGEVGIRNIEREGQPGWDMDEDDAADFADALDQMADGYEDYFASNPPTSAALTAQTLPPKPGLGTPPGLWTFQTGSPGPSTPRQAAVSPDDLAVIRDQWTVITDNVLGPKIAADYLAGAERQHNRLAAALPPKVRRLAGRPLADQAALLYAAGAANRLKGIGDELWAAARAALLEGMAKGESVAKLARRIRDATGMAIGRAMTIARTESMGARSAGSYDEMLNSGVVVSKIWQATGDLRTRPTHVIADGQTVPMAGKFTVGGWPADRPHDPMLPPEEAVNCRCTLTYGLDTDVASAASAAEPAPPDLWIFHLPGMHDQSTHGRGGNSDFDARADSALTGEAAHRSVAYRSGGDVDIDEAIGKYGGEGEASYFDVNRKLRDGGSMTPDQQHTQDGLDKAFVDAKGAGSDMVVHRYMGSDLSVIFGGSAKDYWDNPPNLTGLSWRDKGFISTSYRGEVDGGGVRMRILVPKGTKAISHGGLDPDEILLKRGLKLRVVADHGVTSGTHHLDIEVLQ